MESEFPLDSIQLERDRGQALHLQLRDQLRLLIHEQRLDPGAKVPAIRALATQLAISRNTVVSAYDQLIAEGYLVSRRGSGCRVANTRGFAKTPQSGTTSTAGPTLSRHGTTLSQQLLLQNTTDASVFHPGLPETATFPHKTWGAILKRLSAPSQESLLGYHSISGHAELKSTLASYLTVSRGLKCTPQNIVLTTGGQAALDLLARLLIDKRDTVWMEDPGFIGAKNAFACAGASLVSMPVDENGWSLPAVASPNPKLIYLTPACQHPLGIPMPLDQRLQMLTAAKDKNAWIIEDDYDGEYSFFGDPIPAMQGLADHAPVIYVGTFSKVMFPSLRIGYIVAPPDLATKIETALGVTGQHPSLVLQSALNKFMREGHFSRHLKRMRKLYFERRTTFLHMLEQTLGTKLTAIDGRTGIQIACLAQAPIDDTSASQDAIGSGLSLVPLSKYGVHAPAASGFLLGYAAIPENLLAPSFATLRKILQNH
ncbi:PLP-dependent aminotransferase family protein [Shimia sp.]|uniref:MocR-like pyridoxine biosynthesis transcription factor PdxR n=1 Tax=Shimia sp. TaxID=1954381 RepID=UPI003298B56C